MRRIAIINQKGGVGKTTITSNLGHALAMKGFRVTVVDLDPQGQLAASYGMFRIRSKGMDQVLMDGLDIKCAMIGIRDLLTLVPAGENLTKLDKIQGRGAERARLLEKSTFGKFDGQDFILYDCPPSSGMIMANVVFAVDELIIPVGGDFLSLNGLAIMLSRLKRLEPYLKNPIKKWLQMSRYVQRRRLSQEVRDKFMSHFPGHLLATPIQEAAVMAECPGAGRTIFE